VTKLSVCEESNWLTPKESDCCNSILKKWKQRESCVVVRNSRQSAQAISAVVFESISKSEPFLVVAPLVSILVGSRRFMNGQISRKAVSVTKFNRQILFEFRLFADESRSCLKVDVI
jgi:hypothetical protein